MWLVLLLSDVLSDVLSDWLRLTESLVLLDALLLALLLALLDALLLLELETPELIEAWTLLADRAAAASCPVI
jgi:hypothetical protein